MRIVIPHTLLVMGHQLKISGNGLKKVVIEQWLNYRRRQYLLAKSYQRHPMAQGMPSRVWMRHSALLTLMDERRQHKSH